MNKRPSKAKLTRLVRKHRQADKEVTAQLLKMVEYKARQIMRQHPRLTGFCMAMGSWAFYDGTNHPVRPDYTSGVKYLEPFAAFIDEYDEDFHLTGCPMKFNAGGEVIHHW